jgi:hypothetical protein
VGPRVGLDAVALIRVIRFKLDDAVSIPGSGNNFFSSPQHAGHLCDTPTVLFPGVRRPERETY